MYVYLCICLYVYIYIGTMMYYSFNRYFSFQSWGTNLGTKTNEDVYRLGATSEVWPRNAWLHCTHSNCGL